MTSYVLDASAGVELLLDTDRGRSLNDQLVAGAEWWVPEHYFIEVAAVLRRGELRNVYPSGRVAQALESLIEAPLRRVQVRPLLREAWAARGNLTVPDAVYVALARHLGAELVTADMNLVNAPNLPVATVHP